jgi:RNA polymerase sigma-70 factor (ECF subfamily)
MAPTSVTSAVEEVATTSYGRLVAYLASITRDIATAEDAMADALEAALRTWPARGVPDAPDAWLLQVARRNLVGSARKRDTAERALPALALLDEQRGERRAVDESPVPDKRLELLFACAHPAIDRSVRAPLMLQAVLGIDAARIGAAFLVSPAAMAQRLVRAKAKIRAAGIPFSVPGVVELPTRLPSVLDAIYAAFGTGWEDPSDTQRRTGLATEALRLVRIVTATCPDDAEAHGLHALIAHSHARTGARRDEHGAFVPLSEQDPRRWDVALLEEGAGHLDRAVELAGRGPFVVQACIQAAHNDRRTRGDVDWSWIVRLYQALVAMVPSIGAHVALAAATAEAGRPDDAWAILQTLPDDAVSSYQPYWTTRAYVADRRGDEEERVGSARRAVGLTDDPAVRAHLVAVHRLA